MAEIKKINVDGVDYDIVGKELTKVTYEELKALRDGGTLVEGHLYRITDYVTKTVQTETKSAGNVFDVIVLAISTNELSHNAKAVQHEGDTYFDGNDLGAWKLWYDLDNDTDKYAWADAINGKGVIYRMIDDKANDCPYDFKNILFYNTVYTDIPTKDKYYYTFSYVVFGNQLYDGSVEKRVNLCSYNSMGVRMSSNKMGLSLLFNVFRNTTFRTECHHNTFGIDCHHNTFRDGCNHNTLGIECNYNTFGTQCHHNTFRDGCNHNTFGTGCRHNTFRDGCNHNTFGTGCRHNTFGIECHHNTLGIECNYNTFGIEYHHNTFGHFRSGYKVDSAITMSEEFYDDGSGKLVPVKHPDLSTQPSILPYKFMGQYVYEQLIPHDGNLHHKYNTWFELQDLAIQNPMFLDAQCVMSDGVCPCDIKVKGYEVEAKSNEQREGIKYVRVVYTSMPEEGGGYYGYNSY